MEIKEFFKKEYLTAGNTYDNWIFEGCPDEVLSMAKDSLSQSGEEIKPCVVKLDRETEVLVEKIFGNW